MRAVAIALIALAGCVTEQSARDELSATGLTGGTITITRWSPRSEDFEFVAENAEGEVCSGPGAIVAVGAFGEWAGHITPTCVASVDPTRLAMLCETRDIASACADAARMFRDGNRIPVDYERSFALAGRGCRGGRTDACFLEGIAYENALGTTENDVLAMRSYRLACDADDGAACFQLGGLLEHAMPPDVDDALVAYARACTHPYEARACHAHAQLVLAHPATRSAAELDDAARTESSQ